MAVILAGGKGERMMPLTEFQPKALVPIHGVPILKLQIDQLIRNNVTQIMVLTGHLGEQIHQYVASLNLGTIVTCIQSEPELNPAERINLTYKLFSKPYIILYCDNYIPSDNIIRHQLSTKSGISLVLQKREEGNVIINEKLSAVYVSEERNSLQPYVELGYIAVIDNQFNELILTYKDINLALEDFSKKNQVKFIELVDSYQSLSNFAQYVSQELHGKIIILDRDGILNKKMEQRKYLTSFEMLDFIEENLEVFSKLGNKGFSFIVATNQPGIATGDLSETFLDLLHKKITSYLRLKDIMILAFYVCKHHWDDLCACRKPMPGLLDMCISDFNLIRESTVFIGDEDKDIQAALNANIRGLMSPSNELEIFLQELLNQT